MCYFNSIIYLFSDSEKNDKLFAAFSARKTRFQSVKTGDKVSFEEVLYNKGNYFMPSLNQFVCPANGVYYIYVTMWKNFNSNIHVVIKKNDTGELNIDMAQIDYNTLSNSYMTECEEGEIMYVSALERGSVYARTYAKTTSFTGMLLSATGKNFKFNHNILCNFYFAM